MDCTTPKYKLVTSANYRAEKCLFILKPLYFAAVLGLQVSGSHGKSLY